MTRRAFVCHAPVFSRRPRGYVLWLLSFAPFCFIRPSLQFSSPRPRMLPLAHRPTASTTFTFLIEPHHARGRGKRGARIYPQ